MLFLSFNKDENDHVTDDHVIDIFTSEDMENISLC